jgi:hypothetical protein
VPAHSIVQSENWARRNSSHARGRERGKEIDESDTYLVDLRRVLHLTCTMVHTHSPCCSPSAPVRVMRFARRQRSYNSDVHEHSRSHAPTCIRAVGKRASTCTSPSPSPIWHTGESHCVGQHKETGGYGLILKILLARAGVESVRVDGESSVAFCTLHTDRVLGLVYPRYCAVYRVLDLRSRLVVAVVNGAWRYA